MLSIAKLVVMIAAAVIAGVVTAQSVQDDAKRTKDRLTGDAVMKATDNPQCKLYTVAEVGKVVGKAMKAGQNAGGGAGCQWLSKDEDADVIVTVVAARHYEAPSLAKGFKKLPDVGTRGWVVPEMGGWRAGTIVGDSFVVVSAAGGSASESATVALLQETLKRRKP